MACLIAAMARVAGCCASCAASLRCRAGAIRCRRPLARSIPSFRLSPRSVCRRSWRGPSARAMPTRCGRSHVPPESGTRPIFTNAWMKLAERAASTRSQAIARLAPAPAAVPLTAAITGNGNACRRRISGLKCCVDQFAQIGHRARREVEVGEILARAKAAARTGHHERARAGCFDLDRARRSIPRASRA